MDKVLFMAINYIDIPYASLSRNYLNLRGIMPMIQIKVSYILLDLGIMTRLRASHILIIFSILIEQC